MEIREVDDKGNPIVKEDKPVQTTSQVLQGPPVDEMEVAANQVLGLETDSQKSKYSTKVKTILEWAKLQTKDQTPEGIKWAIRDMQMKIGSPSAGESHIDYLYSFVALSSQKKEIDERLRKYNPYVK